MSKKHELRNSEKRPSRAATEKAVSEELTDKQLDDVTGGAVDVFIQFSGDPARVNRGSDDEQRAFEIKDFSFNQTLKTQ